MRSHKESSSGFVKVVRHELWSEYYGKRDDILGLGIFSGGVFPEGRKRLHRINLGDGAFIVARKAGAGDFWRVMHRYSDAEQTRILAERGRLDARRVIDEEMQRRLALIPVRHDAWLSKQADNVSRFLDISLRAWLRTDCGLGIAAADMAAIRELALQLEQRVRRSTIVLNESARQAYVQHNTPAVVGPRGTTQPRVRHLRVVA